MKLKQVSATGLPGISARNISFCDPADGAPRPVTLITGAPRSGKSTVLRILAAAKEAAGAYHQAQHPLDMVGSSQGGRIAAQWSLSPAERAWTGEREDVTLVWDLATGTLPEVPPKLRDLFARFQRRPDRFKAELFPARRGLDTALSCPLLPRLPDEHEGRSRLRDLPGKYAGALRALHDAAMEQAGKTMALLEERGVADRAQVPDGLAGYKAAVAKMCPSVRLVAIEPRDRVRPLVWFVTQGGSRVELGALSDSELQGFLLAAASVWLELHGSLVLVDTPELHLHPSEHLRFFRGLCDLGRDNQLVVATMSPAILDSVPREHIVDLSGLASSGTP